jgi:hypothetical protein
MPLKAEERQRDICAPIAIPAASNTAREHSRSEGHVMKQALRAEWLRVQAGLRML